MTHFQCLSSPTGLLYIPAELSLPLAALALGTGNMLLLRLDPAIAVAGLASLGRIVGLSSPSVSSSSRAVEAVDETDDSAIASLRRVEVDGGGY